MAKEDPIIPYTKFNRAFRLANHRRLLKIHHS